MVDLIEGITDFHNHLIPGIDDGAKTVEESIQLIKEFQNIGINDFVATPHIIGEYYPNTPEIISKAYNLLIENIDNNVNIGYAAEYMMDQHFIDIIDNKEVLNIIDNNVLVEMSYFQPPINLNEILFKLQNNSFAPILAHPERYNYYHSKGLSKYYDLKSRGCEFQINMLSFSGHYGPGIQKTALKLLENNLVDYICSDVHKLEHIEKIKRIKIPKKFSNKIELVIEKNKNLFSAN